MTDPFTELRNRIKMQDLVPVTVSRFKAVVVVEYTHLLAMIISSNFQPLFPILYFEAIKGSTISHPIRICPTSMPLNSAVRVFTFSGMKNIFLENVYLIHGKDHRRENVCQRILNIT
jgi:hypothetical protein